MRTVKLAGTDLSCSRLGFGLSGLHHLLRSKDRQNLLSSALQGGITYFDSSPFYGHGLAERELGAFCDKQRGRILIASKFGIGANPWFNRFPLLMHSRLAANAALRRLTRHRSFVVAKRYDYGASSAIAALHRSLRALRTDHIDILYLHDPTLARLAEPESLFKALEDLRVSGKIRYFGLAGNVHDCLDILRRSPLAGCLLQVDAAPGNQELELLNASSVPFHSSYGHFRGTQGSIRDALAGAVIANREGVLLFSTRRAGRIGEMVQLLTSLEPP
ncbi:MAG TPA: aldo/keto reductase [Steroidobacteraceae bacterium]|jgi:aryl-alcohol dehydrogenase-like predicted oxidoreductase